MPLPTVKEFDSGGSSLSASGDGGVPQLKGPRKSVRFATDAVYACDKQSHSPGLAAHPPSSGNDDGGTCGPATLDGSGDDNHAALGKAKPDISAPDASPDSGFDAVDAKGHGALPSWRAQFKMPVVEW